MTLTRKQIKRSTRAFCKKIAKRCAKVSARITNSIPRALPHIPNLKKPSSSPKITTCKPPAPSLVPEILDQIFACLLSTCVPDTPHLPSPERYDTLFTLSLVAKSWAACATRLLYKKPFIRRGRYQFEFFLSMLPTEETNNLIANDLTSHFFQARTPIFPYPAYIKELDYGKLVMSAWAFCKAGWDTLPKIDGKVVMAIRALLKVLLQYQPTIVTLKCTLSTYGLSEKYLQVLDEEEFEGLLKNINRVSVIGNYLYGEEEVNVLKGLRNVREIEYSCLAPTQTFSPSMVDYTSLIIRQKHLQILHIDQADKSVDRIIKAIQFQSHSLVELSFTKCGFQITDPWLGIANCRKLQQLEFIECNDIKLEAVAPLLSAEWPCLKKVNLVGEGNDSEPENVCSEFVAWASEFNNKLREVEV